MVFITYFQTKYKLVAEHCNMWRNYADMRDSWETGITCCLAGHVLQRYKLSYLTYYPCPLHQRKVGLILRLLAYYPSM